MTKSYAIGVGGCGAKCIEALIHVCACGLGPDALTLALVDPDNANGNVVRCADVLGRYQRAREALRREGQSTTGHNFRFLSTHIRVNPAELTWSPVPPWARTLQQLFRYGLMADDEKNLFDALYLADEEQCMPLHEGFRGRPSVGAAVLGTLADDQTDPFWTDIFEVAKSAQGEDVRLFLIGSIFGGTGAAGFPVIARMLRDHMRREKVEAHVRLSGVLFLPYFAFPSAPPDADAVAANPNVFLAKAQQSLAYYRDLLIGEKVFDDLYLIGWPKLIALNVHQSGGRQQCNPPLLPELYGALAAARFFAVPSADKAERESQVWHIAILENREVVDWNDLPSIDGNRQPTAKEALGQAMRFAYAYDRIYARYLERGEVPRYRNDSWFRRHLQDVPIERDDEQEAIKAIQAYCEALLRYLITISRPDAAGQLPVHLFENTGFALSATDPEDALVRLRPTISENEEQEFVHLVQGADASSLADIYDGLCTRGNALDGTGLGRFVTSLYTQCALGPRSSTPRSAFGWRPWRIT